MLEVLRSPGSKAADQLRVVDAGFPTSTDQCGSGGDEFMLDGENLLDYIDFTCCDVPSFFDADGEILPDLETELLAEFEDHERGGGKPPDDVASSSQGDHHHKEDEERLLLQVEEEEGQTAQTKKSGSGDEVSLASAVTSTDTSKSSSASAEKKKKKKLSKNSNGKRKVDWTPDLHRRFVQAVEQLGIDKAVPSRILEIMGIEGLTRHNIASHLQKYRSHRKHLIAQEAEAASWAKKRQIYAAAPGAPRLTKDMPPAAAAPWVVPTTIRFPSPPFGRPLHVWGHPSTAVEATAAPMLPVWPRHLAPVDRAYWHQPQYNGARKWGPMTQGTPCVPPPIMPRFPTPPVPGTMMPHPMYRPPMPPPPQITASNLATLQLRLDAHPSKESIDAAIGDVLAKPWLPLPLGLKPPSLDSVMSELHKQGIPKIPPSS